MAKSSQLKKSAKSLKCGFCGRSADAVRLLMAGRIKGAYICDVCILLAMHGLVDKFTVGAEDA